MNRTITQSTTPARSPGLRPREAAVLKRLRSLTPQRSLARHEALHLAQLQAAELRSILGVTTHELPTAAVDLPRITIATDADLPTSSITYWNGESWIIVLSAREHPRQQRFLLFHERKRIIDHPNRRSIYPNPSTYREDTERAADYFADCALMPEQLTRREFGKHPSDLDHLALLFNVSPAALGFRLDQLGLATPAGRCLEPTGITDHDSPRHAAHDAKTHLSRRL